ncbi:MAG: hypothetical protein CL758_01880 [Chloroflexi bacterium]|nr:hypothetical protein [Chloroflexota bacterium]|tara:strand:+ start:58 stop:348 length:291 start_codon:yes stop_codon:yes gene_type:complete
MNPESLGINEWQQISKLLLSLWLTVIFVIIFAANMLLAHNIIPSLLESKHIPLSWGKTRKPMYAVAIISFGVALYFFSGVIRNASFLKSFWPDYWI